MPEFVCVGPGDHWPRIPVCLPSYNNSSTGRQVVIFRKGGGRQVNRETSRQYLGQQTLTRTQNIHGDCPVVTSFRVANEDFVDSPVPGQQIHQCQRQATTGQLHPVGASVDRRSVVRPCDGWHWIGCMFQGDVEGGIFT